jgi:hypothetical protein
MLLSSLGTGGKKLPYYSITLGLLLLCCCAASSVVADGDADSNATAASTEQQLQPAQEVEVETATVGNATDADDGPMCLYEKHYPIALEVYGADYGKQFAFVEPLLKRRFFFFKLFYSASSVNKETRQRSIRQRSGRFSLRFQVKIYHNEVRYGVCNFVQRILPPNMAQNEKKGDKSWKFSLGKS